MRADRLRKSQWILLSVLAVSTALLSAYMVFRLPRVRLMEDNLLREREIQANLLEKLQLEMCLTPHLSSEIAYVLDPTRERCTLWVKRKDHAYRINRLGLRGREIEPKKPGVTRVVVVGDSWPWGVKLHDRDTLMSQLQRRVDGVSPGRFEFVTVAMPGWNTRSEAAFLRAHSGILDPDALIWMVSQNDVNDAMGFISPGIGSIALSPQVIDRAPIMALSQRSVWPEMYWYSTTPMPFVTERWRHNFDLIRSMREFFDVPTLGILAGFDAHLVAFLERDRPVEVPLLYEPLEIDGDDRWSVSKTDGHPSAWGVGMQTLPILTGLEEMGLATGVQLTEGERQTAALWRVEAADFPNEEKLNRWVEEQIAGVPEAYFADQHQNEVAFPGVQEAGRMSDNGVVFLRVEPERGDLLQVDLSLLDEPVDRSVVFVITSYGGAKTTKRLQLTGRDLSTRLALPPRQSRYPLVEVRWEFDSLRCQGPITCASATLERMAPAEG